MRKPDLLTAHLWDLRAQVESQLRCITKIHRRFEALAPKGSDRRAADKQAIVSDLSDVLTMAAAVRGVCESAIEAVEALPD
ncbi:MAG: hypothetical protein AB7O28_22575 [Vicinamibacterales bacterium]